MELTMNKENDTSITTSSTRTPPGDQMVISPANMIRSWWESQRTTLNHHSIGQNELSSPSNTVAGQGNQEIENAGGTVSKEQVIDEFSDLLGRLTCSNSPREAVEILEKVSEIGHRPNDELPQAIRDLWGLVQYEKALFSSQSFGGQPEAIGIIHSHDSRTDPSSRSNEEVPWDWRMSFKEGQEGDTEGQREYDEAFWRLFR